MEILSLEKRKKLKGLKPLPVKNEKATEKCVSFGFNLDMIMTIP